MQSASSPPARTAAASSREAMDQRRGEDLPRRRLIGRVPVERVRRTRHVPRKDDSGWFVRDGGDHRDPAVLGALRGTVEVHRVAAAWMRRLAQHQQLPAGPRQSDDRGDHRGIDECGIFGIAIAEESYVGGARRRRIRGLGRDAAVGNHLGGRIER